MFQMDMDHNMIVSRDEGRDEGRVEGRVEGRDEEKLSIAKKLLKRNRPIDEIIEDTGLSREILESLTFTN